MRTRWLAVAVCALLALAGVEAWRWGQAHRVNVAIEAMQEDSLRALDSPHARFALAARLAAQNATQEALSLYQELEDAAPHDLGNAARFNRAQLYHELALRAKLDEDPHALALAELAKQHYRDLLAREPSYWDARYNLERVLRLVPDAPEGTAEALEAPRQSERAVTTMRGFTLGLP